MFIVLTRLRLRGLAKSGNGTRALSSRLAILARYLAGWMLRPGPRVQGVVRTRSDFEDVSAVVRDRRATAVTIIPQLHNEG